jgi:hypothetical protein
MAIFKKGGFELNLGLLKVSTEVTEEDKQCAWELYVELCTRLSMTGKQTDDECTNFEGEVLAESLDSVHMFFSEARGIMRKFPVGRLAMDSSQHLGLLINDFIVHVLRPFLEKWQSDYRHWWETEADKTLSPFERQKKYPHYDKFLEDWTNVRLIARRLMNELVGAYNLTAVCDLAE